MTKILQSVNLKYRSYLFRLHYLALIGAQKNDNSEGPLLKFNPTSGFNSPWLATAFK